MIRNGPIVRITDAKPAAAAAGTGRIAETSRFDLIANCRVVHFIGEKLMKLSSCY